MTTTPTLTRSDFIALAKAQKGKRYILGAPSPYKGGTPSAFDCSGLCCWLLAASGNDVGDNTAAGLYTRTKAVTNGQYATGDMVFRATNPARYKGIGHVAMLLYRMTNGDWAILEARGKAYGVVLTTLSYWRAKHDFMGVRRLPGFQLLPDTPSGTIQTVAAAMEGPATGGTRDYIGTGRALAKQFPNASIILVTESTLAMRRAYNAALGTRYARRVLPGGTDTAVFYDSRILTNLHAKRYVEPFGNGHGAVGALLADNHGNQLVAVSVHNRPRSQISLAQKKANLEKAFALPPAGPAIVGGDFAMKADTIARKHGFVRATPHGDTFDRKGTQDTDAIFVRELDATNGRIYNPGKWSDHTWESANVAFPNLT